jgi:HrpA-like helicases
LLNSIGTPDFFHDRKCELKSEPEDVSSVGTRYFSLYENQKVKFKPKSEVGECSGTRDVKHRIKLPTNDEVGEISVESMDVTKRVNSDTDVKSGTSSCGRSAADRYSHISESSFKQKFLQNITGNIAANIERSLLVGTSLTQDKELDELFKVRLLAKENSKHYQKMREFRQKLPSFGMKNKILELVEQNQIIVISGETGNNSISCM